MKRIVIWNKAVAVIKGDYPYNPECILTAYSDGSWLVETEDLAAAVPRNIVVAQGQAKDFDEAKLKAENAFEAMR